MSDLSLKETVKKYSRLPSAPTVIGALRVNKLNEFPVLTLAVGFRRLQTTLNQSLINSYISAPRE